MDKGVLYLVATPIGNLEDITFRALNTLKEVDLILAEDTRKTLKLLNHFEISKKLISFYRHNEDVKIDYVIDLLNSGKNLAVVSDAGTPGISDPGEDLVRACIENNIRVIPIPGSCAFVQALICSGFDTTRFVFEGFLPMNKKGRRQRLEELKNECRTIILYEAPHKLKYTLGDMKDYFGGDRRITLARELTKIHEEFLRFTIDEAISYFDENDIKGEFVVLIEKKEKNPEEEIATESVKELMYKYLSEGMDKKEVMKIVAKQKGMRKSDVYKELLV
jgi:16S rRNA (cytidine1402-2'-O)-methyltransferase